MNILLLSGESQKQNTLEYIEKGKETNGHKRGNIIFSSISGPS